MFRLLFFTIFILGSLTIVKACNPDACGAVAAKCKDTCDKCDLSCLNCVGSLWEQCSDCFCPHPVENQNKTSPVAKENQFQKSNISKIVGA